MVDATTIAALACTTAISLAPNVLLFLFPSHKPTTTNPGSPQAALNPLSLGQALAAGGLLGDVFLHTLPHTLTHDNGEVVGMAVLSGFVVFLLFDILVRSSHSHDHSHDDHSHNSCADKHTDTKPKQKIIFSSAVVLNLAADSLHNFTDGIAIGASFAGTASTIDASLSTATQIKHLLKSRGGLASLAVLFHEIPHELGDYSILVSAGMTKSEAILAQFSTAIAAYCGTFVGLFGMHSMQEWMGISTDLMVPFTAGGFVYLAAVTILPGLLEERTGKRGRVAQVLAFLVGIGFMYGVALLEHAGGDGAHGHDHGHSHHGHAHEHGHDHGAIHIMHHDHGHLHDVMDSHNHHSQDHHAHDHSNFNEKAHHHHHGIEDDHHVHDHEEEHHHHHEDEHDHEQHHTHSHDHHDHEDSHDTRRTEL